MKKYVMKWVWLCCCLFTLHALQAQTYEIRGRITDAATQEPLPGATIHDKVNYSGTAADYDGNFRLTNLKRGKTVLTISYLGYDSKELEVTMPDDGDKMFDIVLSDAGMQLSELVVTGSFEGQQRALNLQRSADNIMNVVSADLIGKFPDKNVAEALQRLPGINILRDKGKALP